MKHLEVPTTTNKRVKIILLQDLELLVCVPYAIVAALCFVVMHATFLLVSVPVGLLFRVLRKWNVSFSWLLILFPCVIAAAIAITVTAGAYSLAALAAALAVFLYGATVLGRVFVDYEHLEDPTARTAAVVPLSPSEERAFSRMRTEAAALPDSCVKHPYDKSVLYLGWIRTMLFVPALALLLVAPEGWLNYALSAYLALFSFNDFEQIEHIAAHTGEGKLLVQRDAPRWAVTVEGLRRYVVWTLFGWTPNYYLASHAFHHHVENNGLADWQSTLRYDRTSLLDVAKIVTWYSINFAVPVETLYYMTQKCRFRLVARVLGGQLLHLGLLVLVTIVEPLLGAILIAYLLASGVGMYMSITAWHGFHDPKHQYGVAAGNNSLLHYAHHAKPRVHLWDTETMNQIAKQAPVPSPMVLLKPEFGGSQMTGFWRLQGLLWARDFERAGASLLSNDEVTEVDKLSPWALRWGLEGRELSAPAVKQLTQGCFPDARRPLLRAFDERVSKLVGRLITRGA